jgi:hypothetical protein
VARAAAAAATTEPTVRQMAAALARNESVAAIATANPRLFGDFDGILLVRALSLAGR